MTGFESFKTVQSQPAAKALFDSAYGLGREAKMIGWGVGEAAYVTLANPVSKMPEVVSSAGIGTAFGAMSRMGNSGKVLAFGIGTAMLAKLGYDELTGNRWSTFGKAVADAWHSGDNMKQDVAATRDSLGMFIVDSGIAYGGMRLGGAAASRFAPPGKTVEYAVKQSDFDHGVALRKLQDRWENQSSIEAHTRGKLDVLAYTEPAVAGEPRGDLLRVATTADGKILLSAMDVYGHGTSAARVAVRLQSTIDDILPETKGKSASDILAMIDERLDNKSDLGATAAVSLYDPISHQLETATASSELAFVVRHGGNVEQLDAEVGGMLIGQKMYKDFPRGNEITHLEPGDTVILASDGSFERFQWGARTGFEKFLKETGPHPDVIKNGILSAPEPATGKDDTSFLIFRRAV